MAIDFQGLLNNLNNRVDSPKDSDSPGFKAILAALDGLNANLKKSSEALKTMQASNLRAEYASKDKSSQELIRQMLTAKITTDKLDKERTDRFMKVAEELVPQVTEEQLKAFDAQKRAYNEHQKTLVATLDIEKKKADIQKKAATDMAERQIRVAKTQLEAEKERLGNIKAEAEFAKQDKYGTISSAIGGLSGKGQDPLTKFLFNGLGRYVKERKEAPVEKAINAEYNKGLEEATKKFDAASARQNAIAATKVAMVEKAYATKEADIKEAYAIDAIKKGIKDPGAKVDLYKEREASVARIAQEMSGMEKALVSGEGIAKVAASIDAAGKATIADMVNGVKVATAPGSTQGPANGAISALPSVTPKPAPGNYKFTKASTQSTSPVTPGRGSGARAGVLGSKAGFLDIGGIASGISSLAKNFTKFMGPWGLVANSVMSLDKLVPVISTGAGALTDLTKMIMPLMISSTIEGFNLVMSGINGLVEALDNTILGNKFLKKNKDAISSAQATAFVGEKAAVDKRLASKNARVRGLGGTLPSLDTTTQFGRVTVKKQAAPSLTNPIEESTTRAAMDSNSNPMDTFVSSMESLPNVLAGIQKSVLDSKLQPTGTTPIMVSSPFLTGWVV